MLRVAPPCCPIHATYEGWDHNEGVHHLGTRTKRHRAQPPSVTLEA